MLTYALIAAGTVVALGLGLHLRLRHSAAEPSPSYVGAAVPVELVPQVKQDRVIARAKGKEWVAAPEPAPRRRKPSALAPVPAPRVDTTPAPIDVLPASMSYYDSHEDDAYRWGRDEGSSYSSYDCNDYSSSSCDCSSASCD